MPSAATELMGNTTYRAIVVPTGASTTMQGVLVGLSVNCVTISNTVGSKLELQFAVYDIASQTNTTNFGSVSTGETVNIDGVTGPNFCQSNNSIGTSVVSAPTTPVIGQGWIFRVVGSGGGGTGDNPRFASINVVLYTNFARVFTGKPTNQATTGFTANMIQSLTSISANTATFNWLATNVTTTQCGTSGGSDLHCFESGNNSCSIAAGGAQCSIAITFNTAFSVAPKVEMTSTTAFVSVQYPIGAVSVLLAQTLTV